MIGGFDDATVVYGGVITPILGAMAMLAVGGSCLR